MTRQTTKTVVLFLSVRILKLIPTYMRQHVYYRIEEDKNLNVFLFEPVLRDCFIRTISIES